VKKPGFKVCLSNATCTATKRAQEAAIASAGSGAGEAGEFAMPKVGGSVCLTVVCFTKCVPGTHFEKNAYGGGV
jgi:hypothetical protein